MLKQLVKRAAITGGLELSVLLSRAGLMGEARGLGAIFTLHHVRQHKPRHIEPNRHLEITPEFLEAAIVRLKQDGYRFVALQDVPRLLSEGHRSGPFAAFTLDDGYRDNRDFALPVFERHAVPFTIFVCKGFSERRHSLWWETADALANGEQPLEIELAGVRRRLAVGTDRERLALFDAACDLVCCGDETDAIRRLDDAALRAGFDPRSIPEAEVMSADELRALSAHPLVSLGAHTISHRALARLDAGVLAEEISQSVDYVEAITGKRPNSFAYPYGDCRSVSRDTVAAVARAGLPVAVTTRPGTLSMKHAGQLLELPRISLNGFYQKARYVSALASGIPFRLKRG
ncbi:Peptidoglycan/xylan/chitin deacetylase, PgdA/CDA1 family [Rhizobium sp. RU36D]|nr:Peptidoglycan/xylan/chitin deacetylase, PgdA/CDA1 family [Rhizobium sp. RU36D]